MNTTSSIQISDELLHATRMTSEEVTKELAIHLYEAQKLSLGKATELAGMSRVAFQQLLASRKIPMNYDILEYKEDISTLKKLKRIK